MSTDDLEGKTVGQLKDLLKLQDLPVGGKKKELIQRLREYSGKPKPAVAWQYSTVKKKLKKQLLDPNSSVHKMSDKEVHYSDPDYKQYPLFQEYIKKLRVEVEEEKRSVEMDDLAAKMHNIKFVRGELNKRGYPHWDNHPAKPLLEIDVANNLHKRMFPKDLQKTRSEYQQFPPDVFAKRVYSEATKQRSATFWAFKRNKKGMETYLKNVEARSSGV